MTEASKGVLAVLAACTIWGVSGMFYKLLDHIEPLEVLSHRVLWSFVFFSLLLMMQGRLSALFHALRDRGQVLTLLFATAMVSLNWFVFITSVQIGKATEASLGYYIFPLVTVLLGRVVFGERLNTMQTGAILIATLAVVTLTVGKGIVPWISLLLAGSFAIYSALKKRLQLGPVVSVTAEVFLLLPLVLFVIVENNGAGYFDSAENAALLMLSGPLTGLPLILFSYAARRVALGTVGVLQYLNPTLQFLVAVLVFSEPFGPWQAVAFALIWTAVVMFSVAALRKNRALTDAK